MIQKFASSQVLIPLTLDKPLKYLRSQRRTKFPLASLEVPKGSNQDAGQGKEIETLKGKDKGQDKKKNSSNPTEKASDTAVSQPGQIVDPEVPKTKA